MSQPDEVEHPECPLCMEPLEIDDLNFFPCTCGYQICRFCWHRIRTDENGLCPACRKAYPENPADFKPLSQEQVVKMKAEKRQKDLQKKQKATESRKHLSNVRVVQKNLVFVVGLPMRLADHAMLKKHDYFGKFGRILKVVINQSTTYAGATGPSASAYVTYSKCDDALRAIEAVNNICVDSRILKTSLGTTKYCSHFIKSQSCPKTDCMYLHDFGDSEASFTKEEMQQGKHQEYEKKLHEQLNLNGTIERKTASPPQGAKTDAWPTLNINGVSTAEPETKPVPAAPATTEKTNGKGKRHGKEKQSQEKGKRKGKEKNENQSESLKAHPLQSSQSETCIKNHALQTSQSESCINSQRNLSTNQTNRASMIFENSSIYTNGINNSNSDGIETTPVVNTTEEEEEDDEASPPLTPPPQQPEVPTQQSHNGYHDNSLPPSPTPPVSQSPPPMLNDDELGFDPFQETQKGLADLLEKELALQRKETELANQQPVAPSMGHNMYNLHNYQPPPHQHLDPAILNQIHSNHHRVDTSNRGLERRGLPPPGFSAPLPHQPHQPHHHTQHTPMMHHQHDLYASARQPLNGTKLNQSFYFNNSMPKMVDWPENLRNLVHDSSTHSPHPLLQSQHNPVNSINRPDKGWNNANNFADWTALDPAIMSTRPMGINVHSPPPNMYNPNMNGLNGYGGLGGLGGLNMPNWSQRYQDAYYKTHIHNTSVPPPGFSLLHQGGSGLKPGLSSGIETMD